MKICEVIKEGKYSYPISSLINLPVHPDEPSGPHEIKMRARKNPKLLYRGPHEGRYLTLMLAGMKPAAVINTEELSKFQKYIKNGKIKVIGKFPKEEVNDYIITIPGEEWRGKKLIKIWPELSKAVHQGNVYKAKLIHAQIGMLLGYPKEAIKFFIDPN